ncbi:MAG TPA: arsinothricin resistance N-acetyltransferase ArsN1 family B [Candidatus Sulfotelmatobacter sp.]|nr:arsinothricin resistance N-acetyltransferase ArsN1 family B [Candidatus Sulfotelmatobacter sp.]
MSELAVRVARPADGAAFAAIYGPIVAQTIISFEERAPGADEMGERVRAALERHAWLTAEVDGAIAGYGYAAPHRSRPAYRWDVDVSIYVAPAFRGRGIGSRLYRALFAILALQGYQRAYAGIALPNPASVAVHEAAGFRRIGVHRRTGFKFGRWHDVGWWDRAIRDDAQPAEPRPLAALAADEVRAALAV